MGWPLPTMDVLYEDNHLLVVNKPAALPTMGVAAGEPSALVAAKQYVQKKYDKPGNVYLGIVSRLDAPVSGVLVLARTSKAASRLAAAFKERTVEKIYWAVTEAVPAQPAATLEHYIRKDERHKKVHITHAQCPAAQFARLAYRTLSTEDERAWLEIELETGRKHQIRIQLAQAVGSIVGDRKYGSPTKFRPGIALHARRLCLVHPVRDEAMEFEAPLPRSWRVHPSTKFAG